MKKSDGADQLRKYWSVDSYWQQQLFLFHSLKVLKPKQRIQELQGNLGKQLWKKILIGIAVCRMFLNNVDIEYKQIWVVIEKCNNTGFMGEDMCQKPSNAKKYRCWHRCHKKSYNFFQ